MDAKDQNSNGVNGKIYGIAFLLAGVLVLAGAGCAKNLIKTDKDASDKNVIYPHAAAPVEDSGEIEATILDIYHPKNPQIDYGKIRVDKIIEFEHHPNANYAALTVGDEVDIYFQWGAQAIIIETSPDNINLPGVTIGDKIRVRIQGCPGCGNGWTLDEYLLIK